MIAPLLLLLAGTPAQAEDAPRYLLGDVGVRIVLPDNAGWNNIEWADWTFKADARGIILHAWAHPFQVDITEADLSAWADYITDHVTAFGIESATVSESSIGSRRDVPSVELTLTFTAGKAGKGTMYVSGFAVRGQVYFMATVAAERRARTARRTLDALLEDLEVRAPASPVTLGGPLSAGGREIPLGETWRAPLDTEEKAVSELLSERALQRDETCAVAVSPVINGTAPLLVACDEPLEVGILDAFSYTSIAEELTAKYLGASVEMREPELVELPDRSAVILRPAFEDTRWNLAVVPTEDGITKLWVVGDTAQALIVDSMTKKAALETSWGAPPTPSAGEQVGYFLRHRPLHPAVLCPVGGAIGLGGLVGGGALIFAVSAARRRRPRWDDDDI